MARNRLPGLAGCGKTSRDGGRPDRTLVVVDQTPGPDEAPLWGVDVGGTMVDFDYLKRWRFVVPNA